MGKLLSGIKPIQFLCTNRIRREIQEIRDEVSLSKVWIIDIYFRWFVCVTQLSEYNIVLGFALYLRILYICIVIFLCYITMV